MAIGIKECREHVFEMLEKNNFDFNKALNNGYISANLLLTHSCNLSCSYCYQSKEFKSSNMQMTTEIADKAVAFVHANHPNIKDKTVSLFGGEPYTRFELIKYLVEKYPQVNFSVTTNGSLLISNPEYLDWTMRQENLFVSLSINGLKFNMVMNL